MMKSLTLTTPQLDLELQPPDKVLAWVDSLPPEVRKEISPVWLDRVKSSSSGDVWALSFNMIERESGSVVGVCAFKGPPDAYGTVEIAYGVDEPFRRRGYATQAAEALTKYALSSGAVTVVRAHTLAVNDASVRTLEKCGFTCMGDVIDPEDGPVIRWERRVD